MEKSSIVQIAPSILAGNFSCLGEEVRKVEASGADAVHFDVMDGHFVPNLTMGPDLVRCLRPLSKLTFEVHLMVERPADYIESFVEAGADMLCFHIEAENAPSPLLEKIKELGVRCGLAINPSTPVVKLKPFLSLLDYVLVMSVVPGFSGQRFMPEVLEKASWLREEMGQEFLLAMDGGINLETACEARKSGVNFLVAATAIFKSDSYCEAISCLRGDK